MESWSTWSWMKRGGMGLLALGVAIHLVFGVAETVGGEARGWFHFIPAAILAVLLYLAVGHPYAVGLTLLAVAAVLACLPAIVESLDCSSSLLALPPLLAGALLVAAYWQPGQGSMLRPPPA